MEMSWLETLAVVVVALALRDALYYAARMLQARRDAAHAERLPDPASRPLRIATSEGRPRVRRAKVSRYQSSQDPYFDDLDEL